MDWRHSHDLDDRRSRDELERSFVEWIDVADGRLVALAVRCWELVMERRLGRRLAVLAVSAEVEQDAPSFEASEVTGSGIVERMIASEKEETERVFAEKGPEAFDWDQWRQLLGANVCRPVSSPSLTTLVSIEEKKFHHKVRFGDSNIFVYSYKKSMERTVRVNLFDHIYIIYLLMY